MYYLGIDLGGTNIAIGVVDSENVIIKKASCPTLAQRGPYPIVADMAKLAESLISECGIVKSDIAGIGIAAPGTINTDTGIVECSFNIKCVDFPIRKEFARCFGVSEGMIKIGNDANLAAYGEYVAGAAKGTDISVMITLGTGVGGGVIIGGKVLTGAFHGGAELGHMVLEYGGRPCTCGRNGCLEAYCSATALIKLTKEKFVSEKDTLMHDICDGDVNNVGGKTAFAAMKQGDKVGAEIVDEFIGYLACGITDLINIFQPEVISIGGGVSNERDNLLVPLREKVRSQIYSADRVLKTKILRAELGNDAGIIGAAAISK